jgi:4-amino-4-deoxy-L-arabinose transferase-like glycosyltransferase
MHAVLYGAPAALAVYFLARELLGKDTALYAALILSSSFLFVGVVRVLPTEAAWLCLTALAFLAYVYSRSSGPASSLLLALSYAAMGLAYLRSGYPAFFPVLVFFLDGYLQEKKTSRGGARGALRHALLLTGTWLVFVLWLGSDIPPQSPVSGFFFDDAAARTGLTRHAGKVIYYLPVLLLAIFPWTFFAAAYFVKEGRRWIREPALEPNSRLLLLWVSIVVGLFPFIAAKSPHTIVLALPPLSCLLARFIKRDLRDSPDALRFALLATIIAAGCLAGAAVALHFVRPEYASVKLLAPSILLTIFLVIAWILKNREGPAMFGAICLGALALYASALTLAL